MLQSILMLFLQTSPFFLGLAPLTAFGHKKAARILTNGVHNDLERKPTDSLEYMLVGRGCRYREGLVTVLHVLEIEAPLLGQGVKKALLQGTLPSSTSPTPFSSFCQTKQSGFRQLIEAKGRTYTGILAFQQAPYRKIASSLSASAIERGGPYVTLLSGSILVALDCHARG